MTADQLLTELEIRRLGERFADAANRREYDLFAALWAEDGRWEIGPPIDVRFDGRAALRQGIEQMLGRWDFFVQMPHAFSVEVEGDRAKGYWTMHEVARAADGSAGNSNLSLYLDDLVRVEGRWLFARRRYRTIYSDETPLRGCTCQIAPEELHRLRTELDA